MKLTQEDKDTIKAELKKHFGTASLTAIRKELKKNAKLQYGCYFIEIPLRCSDGTSDSGITVAYTSNPNHFAKYFVKLRLSGMTDTMALEQKDITRAGHTRGCGNYFVF
jgi:hypothetical protein